MLLYIEEVKTNRKEFENKVIYISNQLRIDPNWLMLVMYSESRLRPWIENSIGATGLIQFMPKTAIGLGTTTAALKKMSNIEQLDYVYKYFKPKAGKYRSYFDLYLYTFFPIAIGKPDDWILQSKDNKASEVASDNPAINKWVKDNIITVGEFRQYIKNTLKNKNINIGDDIPSGNPNPNSSNSNLYASTQTPANQEVSRGDRSSESTSSDYIPVKKNNVEGNGVGIVNIFPPDIKINPIKFDLPLREDEQAEIARSLANFPFVWYNAYQIEVGDIQYFRLYNEDNLPAVKIIFRDTLNLMKDKAFPLDDTKIKIYLNPRNTILKPVFMEFKITNFNVSEKTYIITGTLDINKLYIKEYKSYSSLSSYDTVQKIAKDCGLGFNTNMDSTNDKMTWINTGERVIDFLSEVVQSAYKSDNSFLYYYIDYYYNINYVDIQSELVRSIKNELGVINIGLSEMASLQEKETTTSLFLTNDFSLKESNLYFDKYRVINNSTSISLEEGYKTDLTFYDQKSKDILSFGVDSITSEGDKTIILKGAPQDETFFNDNVKPVYAGKLDSDNMHKNFHYSSTQNDRNIYDLEKVGIELELKTPNYNIYRFQKIFLILSNLLATPSQTEINNRLTGEWLITDIQYQFDGNKFRQIVKLVKRELELSNEELNSEALQNPKKSSNNRSSGALPAPLEAESGSNSLNEDLITSQSSPIVPSMSGSLYDRFVRVTILVIKELEGGYYNPLWHSIDDRRYGSSGETMYGIDRKAGGAINRTPSGIKFWTLIDNNKTKEVWKWNYIPKDPLATELRKLATDVMWGQYQSYAKIYMIKETRDIVESDPRLLFHMSYAGWNGSSWFKKFANDLTKAIKSGIKDTNSLVQIAINSRTKEGLKVGSAPNSLIKQGGEKIAKFINTSKVISLA